MDMFECAAWPLPHEYLFQDVAAGVSKGNSNKTGGQSRHQFPFLFTARRMTRGRKTRNTWEVTKGMTGRRRHSGGLC